MASDNKLKIVLCWHMHQPEYRDLIADEFQFPWVYLHSIKDYVDMAAHLEMVPDAKAVVNFSPVLLEQLQVYEKQIKDCLAGTGPIRDPLLSSLDCPVFPSDNEHRVAIIKACMRANRKHQIERFKPYQKLVDIADMVIRDEDYSTYLSNQFLADLVTWYHLAWLGETVRRRDDRVKTLMDQAAGFTLHQRRILMELIGETISSIRTQYKLLSEKGQVELSMSPYSHPMLPLLLDFNDAKNAQPDIHLPVLESYPGGMERADWHMHKGLQIFEEYFSERPVGCWPSEGGISDATVKLIENCGFKWIATGENVLRNSINNSETPDESGIYHSFKQEDSDIRIYARDDALSDLIGFNYAEWHADDAVGDLIHRLEAVAHEHHDKNDLVVSIIMDGENAWEYYPENAYYFLSALYQRITENEKLQLCTYRELVDVKPARLESIVSGSWVYGTFSTWIGDEDKNRGWDILGDVKHLYDEIRDNENIDEAQKERIDIQLAICEGSDWFWWFGDYNPASTVSDFERLYRLHIVNLYHLLGKEPPQYLSQILSHGTGSPELGGVIRHGKPD